MEGLYFDYLKGLMIMAVPIHMCDNFYQKSQIALKNQYLKFLWPIYKKYGTKVVYEKK